MTRAINSVHDWHAEVQPYNVQVLLKNRFNLEWYLA